MSYGYRPEPVWRLYSLDGQPPIDISDDALSWAVKFGCSYDPTTGRFRLLSARGFIELDNKDGHYDTANTVARRISDVTAAVPRLIELVLAGETLWQGYAVVRAQLLLTPGRTVVWELRGRYWQELRRHIQWRQTNQTVVGATSLAIGTGLLAEALDNSGIAALAPGSTETTDWYQQHSLFTGTLAASWNLLAWATASLPFEDRAGRLGLSAVTSLTVGRQTTAPATQRALEPSTIESIPTVNKWTMVARARNLVAVNTPVKIRSPNLRAGETTQIYVRWPYPGDVVTVDWAEAPVTDSAHTTVDDWRVVPAADGSRTDVLIARVTNTAMAPPATGPWWIEISGTAYTLDSQNPYIETAATYLGSLPSLGAARQEPPPWVTWTPLAGIRPQDPDVQSTTLAYIKMSQLLNEAKLGAELHYDLWADTPANRMPSNVNDRSGQLVPGSMSLYRIDATTTAEMLTLAVELVGGQGRRPQAIIDTISTSEGSGITDGTQYPIPIPDPDTPGPIPDPPDTPTPTPPPGTFTTPTAAISIANYTDAFRPPPDGLFNTPTTAVAISVYTQILPPPEPPPAPTFNTPATAVAISVYTPIDPPPEPPPTPPRPPTFDTVTTAVSISVYTPIIAPPEPPDPPPTPPAPTRFDVAASAVSISDYHPFNPP